MFLLFIVGFLSGVLSLLLLALLLLFNVFGKRQLLDHLPSRIQPEKARIPPELKTFLRSGPDGKGSEWESCSSLSLLLHFLFQEHKDTRQFRRWMYKKLQLELNDVTARSSAAGRIIQGIQIRDLEAGTNSPMVKNVRVEGFGLAEDDPDSFEELVLLLDLDYRGGFQMSVDAMMAFGKFAQLSVKLLNLSGRARLTIRRQPFAHWSFSFVENPQMELKIESQFQGRNLRHLIPLIGTAFRKVLQLKHVWPNYKLRFRPFFQNPLFNPSPNFAALEHIELTGAGLEITVLSSSRLNTFVGAGAQKFYCRVVLEKRPHCGGIVHKKEGNASSGFREASHLLSTLLAFSRKGAQEKLGLTFGSKDGKEVRVEKVEPGSNAEKCGFRVGDCLVAVNNIPVRNDRQASRLLSGTAGDLMVLVERELEGGGSEREPTPLTLSPPESPPAPLANGKEDFFELLETPPMEFRARDEPEEEQEVDFRFRRTMSKEDSESMEMQPLVQKGRRPSSLQETPKRPDQSRFSVEMPTPMSPSTPQIEAKARESMAEGGKERGRRRKALRRIVRSGSIRAGKIATGRGRTGPRRSRSESSLVRLKVPEVRVQDSEEELDKSLEEPLLPFGPHLDRESSTDAPEKASISTGGEEKEKHSSRRERVYAKANLMAKAGKSKISDFWEGYKKKQTEFAVEANDETMEENSRKLSGTTMDQLEKPKEKRKSNRKKNKSPSPSFDVEKEAKRRELVETDSNKRTKSVQMTKSPIWGQSLHFPLQKHSSYLNVLVMGEREGGEDVLLGYTSIYVPRIVDDCMLTLSNSHRERFHLKGPKECPQPLSPELEEISHHNGFDPRLCFGDIVLGFRFFPEGLPEELLEREGKEMASQEEEHIPAPVQCREELVASSSQTPSPPFPSSTAEHKWLSLNPKQVAGLHFSCGLCGGKIWLKGGHRCDRCHLVCHNNTKCQERAKSHECRPNPAFSFNDDAAFEEMDLKELEGIGEGEARQKREASGKEAMEKRKSATEEQIGAQMDQNKAGFRRRKIAEKIQTTWKNVGGHIRRSKVETETNEARSTKGSDLESPSPDSPIGKQQGGAVQREEVPEPLIAVSEVLDRQFLDSLEGFPAEMRFEELRFEPGNAYNPQVICEAKSKGQNVFGGCAPGERKANINLQIDRVQAMIERVTRQRRCLPEKTGQEFDQVDNRLQALALVMLLYCSGLSDCVDNEEAEERAEREAAKQNGQQNGSTGTEEEGEGDGEEATQRTLPNEAA